MAEGIANKFEVESIDRELAMDKAVTLTIEVVILGTTAEMEEVGGFVELAGGVDPGEVLELMELKASLVERRA